MFSEKNYIEKTHYINIGSVDRNWVDNRESRYNYTVKFEPTIVLQIQMLILKLNIKM